MAGFEEQLTALETVVERLERGELTLDESVRLFEEGVKLSNACKKELEAAEGRIQVLVEQGSGETRVVELDVDAVEEEEDEE
jgi:exodeoxyribonuclease VII small subunit